MTPDEVEAYIAGPGAQMVERMAEAARRQANIGPVDPWESAPEWTRVRWIEVATAALRAALTDEKCGECGECGDYGRVWDEHAVNGGGEHAPEWVPCPACGGSGSGERLIPESATVEEGWWHPNVKSGQVHDHPQSPGGSWSVASHRLCERVYTHRLPSSPGGPTDG